jgi:hypothetical protein
MSPRVSAVLQLVSEMTADERKAVREELAIDEVAAGLGRKVPRVSKAIQDELEWRFVNDTGPGVPYKEAIAKAVKTARSMRQKSSA